MVRSILFGFIVIFTVLIASVGYWKLSDPVPVSHIAQKQRVVQQTPSTPPQVEMPAVVQALNQRNSTIRTFNSRKVSIKLWERGLKFNLDGALSYEKATNFRIIFESRFGTELDLGSNEKVFWYWSRRDKRPGVYYASYDDYQKTRLKTPFNPIFLRQSLGLEELTVNDTQQILESETDLVLVYPRKNSMGDPILYSVFVDKASKRVTGVIITDVQNKPLASAEIQAYDEAGLPLQILYMWYEEDKAAQFRFEGSEANAPISRLQWAMPTYTPQINMADELARLPE